VSAHNSTGAHVGLITHPGAGLGSNSRRFRGVVRERRWSFAKLEGRDGAASASPLSGLQIRGSRDVVMGRWRCLSALPPSAEPGRAAAGRSRIEREAAHKISGSGIRGGQYFIREALRAGSVAMSCRSSRTTLALRELLADSARRYRAVTALGVKLVTTLPTQAGWQPNPEWRSVTARTHPASGRPSIAVSLRAPPQ
jgi:hypothetical protein